MPLQPTGVPSFDEQHPKYDGRGVLIAILDSGTDPGVAGLQQTATGARKILDLRDFSDEGSVPLTPIVPEGGRVTVGTRTLTGFGRIISYSVSQRYFAGTIEEIPLGTPLAIDEDAPPGSDLNGNGRYTDTLVVVVARTQSGWALFADTDGDGSLGNERPVHDFLVGRETFAWAWGGPAPLTIAANFAVQEDVPQLALVFDTSGHGTHVAGIAAGHNLYGIDGFDGVAPGAQMIALKISNNARGGISVSGSIVSAMRYAIEFAEQRQLPLVMNLSFGVGNEQEGSARIDAIVDSMLTAHPDVVMTVSAGNDGPGLSTIGFPGSANHPISVGATFPLVFLQRSLEEASLGDPIAFFSARGGRLAKPDVVAPGVAYSTVPPWNTGQERNAGTSMAAPHVAGLAARLMSALQEDGVSIDAALIKRALMVTALPLDGADYVDQGTGLPSLPAALRWLRQQAHDAAALGAVPSIGHLSVVAAGDDSVPPRTVTFRRGTAGPVRLESSASWIEATDIFAGDDSVTFVVRAAPPPRGRARTGVVTGWGDDPRNGPLFRLVETAVMPLGAGQPAMLGPMPLEPGETDRLFFWAEAGRPFALEVSTGGVFERMFTSLHEPGGMPFRGDNGIQAGPTNEAAVYRLDGSDVLSGIYQLATVASPVAGGQALMEIHHSPFHLSSRHSESDLVVTLANRTGRQEKVAVTTDLIGSAYRATIQGGGERMDEPRVGFTIPEWARELEIDLGMDRSAWARFTDFGFTVVDTLGRIVADGPLNYATGRLRVELLDRHRGMPLYIAMLPGLADPEDQEKWSVNLSVRFYAKRGVPLEPKDRDAAQPMPVEAGQTWSIRYPITKSPWPLSDGFTPLGQLSAQTEGTTWTMQVVLPPPAQIP